MPTTPPSYTTAPTVPDPGDAGTFDARAYAFTNWQKNNEGPEMAAMAANAYANALDALASATAAATQAAQAAAAATTAAAAAGATVFSGVTAYAQYAVVISPTDSQTYRRKTAGTNSLDPFLDVNNWVRLSGIPRSVKAMQALVFLNS